MNKTEPSASECPTSYKKDDNVDFEKKKKMFRKS